MLICGGNCSFETYQAQGTNAAEDDGSEVDEEDGSGEVCEHFWHSYCLTKQVHSCSHTKFLFGVFL